MKTTTNIKSGSLSEARREFLKKSGSLAVMSMFGVAFFTSCSTDDTEPNNGGTNNPPTSGNGISVTADAVTVDLAVATSLAAAGGWALVTAAKVLIVNMGNNSFNALTSVCTHSQCDRNWTFTNNVFTCTCHGSRFNTNGSVVNGPATQALRSYPATVSNNVLTVDLG
ncbi:ubiquinol-cytochrome c reductase iron-sulfur subunit [Aquiflexum sp.]|uniref:QcrA and Rieske domain-containing protein n=1 Tax=Aquiflexum sp. TaxID=1872584 RepID=UPI0035948268